MTNAQNFTPLPPEIIREIGPEMIPRKHTEEEAAKYLGQGKGYGRIPRAIAKEVVSINNNKKYIIREGIKKRNLIRKTKKGLIIQKQELDVFLEEFLKNGGNATQAALVVGNYRSIASASAAGRRYLGEAKDLARLYLEKKGHGYGKMLEEAAKKMQASKTPEWWDRLMKLAGYHDFLSKDKSSSTAIVNIIQSHKDLTSSYIEGEIEEVESIEENEDET